MPSSLLRDREPVDLDFEEVVYPYAGDAVGLHAAPGYAVHRRAVDDVVDLVGADADLQRVGGLAAGIGLLHGAIWRFGRQVFRRFTLTLLHQPRSILSDEEVRVALVGAFEIAAAENQTVVVGVAARLHERER